MTYAFVFDASACSGCKACQIACKDKNNLPLGVLWRRVYEVSGGGWQKQGNAWVTDTFAYNLSIACNHCAHPKCAGVCPANAFILRADGIVLLDSSKCMGCGYCNWVCPYSVPQYNYKTGSMTKCDFCYDNLEQNLPPACVAACPLRVLEVVEVGKERPAVSDERLGRSLIALWEVPGMEHPYPLPAYSRTEPHLAIKPHVAMLNALEKVISNTEEVMPLRRAPKVRRPFGKPRSAPWSPKPGDFRLDELPLVIFTLLMQMAAGTAVFSLFLPASSSINMIIGLLLVIGVSASILHLGKPMIAWRALSNLHKSWLSREILMLGLFGGSWLLVLISPEIGKWILAITGVGLVYSMTQVYRFKASPAWNTWRTLAAFFLAAGTLGALATSSWSNSPILSWSIVFLLAGEMVALPAARPHCKLVRELRLSLIWVGILAALVAPFLTDPLKVWANIPIFLIVFAEEILGRWLFYESRGVDG
jgi:anaerobic dimethyl sulfoxide reductase subunit B (iron-sulfur subunit)